MKAIILTLCLLACAAAAPAIDDKKKGKSRPDLSGTWQLDRSKSKYGLFNDLPLSKADSALVVEHKDPELKIRRTLSLKEQQEVNEFAYYTDGRGETNQATLGVGEVKSKTKWDGDKVVSEARATRPGLSNSDHLDVTQMWRVSSDGKTLTHTTLIHGKVGEVEGVQELKLVYRRAQ
ncbi:MAG: hypothetical protein ABW208_28290 [Pyrinomonadaceae bacterium]